MRSTWPSKTNKKHTKKPLKTFNYAINQITRCAASTAASAWSSAPSRGWAARTPSSASPTSPWAPCASSWAWCCSSSTTSTTTATAAPTFPTETPGCDLRPSSPPFHSLPLPACLGSLRGPRSGCEKKIRAVCLFVGWLVVCRRRVGLTARVEVNARVFFCRFPFRRQGHHMPARKSIANVYMHITMSSGSSPRLIHVYILCYFKRWFLSMKTACVPRPCCPRIL